MYKRQQLEALGGKVHLILGDNMDTLFGFVAIGGSIVVAIGVCMVGMNAMLSMMPGRKDA